VDFKGDVEKFFFVGNGAAGRMIARSLGGVTVMANLKSLSPLQGGVGVGLGCMLECVVGDSVSTVSTARLHMLSIGRRPVYPFCYVPTGAEKE